MQPEPRARSIDRRHFLGAIGQIPHRHLPPAAAVVQNRLPAQIFSEPVDGGIQPLLRGIGGKMGELCLQADALREYVAFGVGFVFPGDSFS